MERLQLSVGDRLLGIEASGNVYSEKGCLLTQYTDADGYKYVAVRINGKRKKLFVHRLVAKAYIPTADDSMQINHLDGNKSNNSISNIEWCTVSQNQMHSRYVLGNQTGFQDVAVKCIETGEQYESTRAAWRATGVNYCHISECANGKRKTAGGYHWERM